jgi:SNF2 family DNA or RNA helicase
LSDPFFDPYPTPPPPAAKKDDFAAQIADHDVVLTTYHSIATNRFYAAVDWHRIVLDECQEIKKPSTTIAAQVRLFLGPI